MFRVLELVPVGVDVSPEFPMNHWKVSGEEPDAATVSEVELPREMFLFWGCVVMEGATHPSFARRKAVLVL